MKIKEVRLLSPVALRNLCIRNNWYTCGSNTEYSHLLLDLTYNGRAHMTTDEIEAVARDIIMHSSNIDEDEQDVLSIMWSVNEVCNTTFHYEDEE